MQAWESLKFSRSIKVGEFISSAVPPDTTYFRVAINKRAKTAEGIGARIFSRDLKLFLFRRDLECRTVAKVESGRWQYRCCDWEN